MAPEITIRTDRLDLVASTLEHVDTELSNPSGLAGMLGAHVPGSWPPGEYDRDALNFFLSKLSASPDSAGWYGWYVITRGPGGARESLVAGAGYLGPPSPDGEVEVGFSVVPEQRGKGYATEAVRALVEHALNQSVVDRVIAHTTDANIASTAVLLRSGFTRVGAGSESGSVRYELPRSAAP